MEIALVFRHEDHKREKYLKIYWVEETPVRLGQSRHSFLSDSFRFVAPASPFQYHGL